MPSALEKIWKRIMAKETTTTFTVTVKHNGTKRGFWECFKRYGQINSATASEVSTGTVDIAPVSMYTDEQKMIRAMLKQCCVKAGLAFNNQKNRGLTRNLYKILYNGSRSNEFRVELNKAYILFAFSKGFGAAGKVTIKELGVKYKSFFNSSGPDMESYPINLANPDVAEELKTLFVKWGVSK